MRRMITAYGLPCGQNDHLLKFEILSYTVPCSSQSSGVIGGNYGSVDLSTNAGYVAGATYWAMSCWLSTNGTIIGCATVQGTNLRVAAATAGNYTCQVIKAYK